MSLMTLMGLLNSNNLQSIRFYRPVGKTEKEKESYRVASKVYMSYHIECKPHSLPK